MRSHSKALVAVAALFAFLLVPSSAFAAKSVERTIETGPTAGALAVNDTSGDLYVQNTDADRIQRYDDAGSFINQFGSNGSGPGQFSFGGTTFNVGSSLAIDQSDGSLYVADTANNRIQKLQADGTFVAMWGDGVNQSDDSDVCTAASGDTCGPGNAASGNGEFSGPRGVAVGPAGDVYVADTANSRVQRLSSAGVYQAQFSDQVFSPVQIGVDSNGRIYLWDGGVFSPVLRFASNGAFEREFTDFTNVRTVRGLTVDRTTDNVFVGGGVFGGQPAIYELAPDASIIDTHPTAEQVVNALALPSSGNLLYGTSTDHDRVLVLTDVGSTPPAVAIEPVTGVGTETATFHGTVNPNGVLASDWRFEYSTDGAEWTSTSGGQVPAGTSPVPVEETVEGLAPNTDHRVRLAATPEFNDQATTSGEVTFTTEAAPPVVAPLYAGVPTENRAWLGAKVNPQNAATTFYIEYSTDPSFANSVSVPASQDAPAGSGGELLLVNRLVSGLQPNTTYYFRVVATNVAGTTTGDARSFDTLAPAGQERGLPDGRVWEKVSPSDKRGAPIFRGNFSTPPIGPKSQAAVSGDAVTYSSGGKFGGDSGPAFSQYLARRGIAGWTTEGISPFHEPGFDIGNVNRYEWFSDDLSKGVASTSAALNPGNPAGILNLYRRDNQNGTYLTVSNGDASTPKDAWFKVRAASANGDHIVFTDFNRGGLYEWTDTGEVRDVAVLPDGTPSDGEIGRAVNELEARGLNPISKDGTRIFFTAKNTALYVRENGVSTTLVSASERTGDDHTAPLSAEFLAASPDGSVVFFQAIFALTDESPAGDGLAHLYRWDSRASPGQRLEDLATALENPIEGSSTFREVGVSRNGNSFYFTAGADFTAGVHQGSPAQPSLYLWREGEGIRLIAKLAPSDSGLWSTGLNVVQDAGMGPNGGYRSARVTPDGRYLAFASTESLTAYDTNQMSQLYLYDSETGQLSCASCSTFEAKSKNPSWFLACSVEDIGECKVDEYLSRSLSEDGRRLVFDSKDALVPEDTNGMTDVYEWSVDRPHLLSSGTSVSPSWLMDASADGDDVFFTTAQRLVSSDKDELVDLYDARVGGTSEPSIDIPCVADECQGTPAPPPGFQTPASSGLSGAGNTRSAKLRCRKGKVRRKGRCATRKDKHRRRIRQVKHNWRTGR